MQCRTETPGAELTRVQFLGKASDFSPGVNFQCRLSHSVCTAPVSVQSHASTPVRTLMIPSMAATYTIVWTHENTHTFIRMGSAALAAAVPYPGKASRISCQWQRSTWTILIIQSPWLLTIISPSVLHKDWFRMSGRRVDLTKINK